MALKVIGAGFGRTGTMSLKVALEELGFSPCYHMSEVLFENPSDAELWQAAARGECIDWDELLGGYQATVDWPGCTFWEQLMEEYPDAKVLLSVRDPDKWYESTRSTIYGMRRMGTASPVFSIFSFLVGLFVPGMKRAAGMVNAIVWEGTFGGKFEDRERAIEVFNRHNEEVKLRVPPEKLLVYEVKDGWEPLCEFLGVEAPDGKPFPHLNDAETFRSMIRKRFAIALAVPAGVLLASLALIRFLSLRRTARAIEAKRNGQ